MAKNEMAETVSTLVALARYFDVSERTARTWKAAGMPVGQDRTYDLHEIERWLEARGTPHGPRSAEQSDDPVEQRIFDRLVWDYEYDRALIGAVLKALPAKVLSIRVGRIDPKYWSPSHKFDTVGSILQSFVSEDDTIRNSARDSAASIVSG